MVKLTYLYNSGFLIQKDDVQLIIDYCDPTPAGQAVWDALHSNNRVIALATHAHGDHFQPIVCDWARNGLCSLVLGADIPRGYPATYLSEGESTVIQGVKVRAFGSTDQGVSFLMDLDGLTVFHAGDLNDWHWQAESTPEEVRAMRDAFERVLDALPAGIDIALFPVDPRMGEDYDRGAVRFIERMRPKLFVPMHFRDSTEAAERFAARRFPGTKIVTLTAPGQHTTIEEDELT